jgi:YD repeat-containing protein
LDTPLVPYADDTLQSMTDARGVVTSYLYNNRHLPTNINYNVNGDPTGSTVATPPVSFAYDAAGNRASMTDGLGSASYGYDSLSRMTSEARTHSAIQL